jgi:DNA-binding transcriptional regulator YiaG
MRFSAKSVKAQRAKTGLSAADYAMLVGVSALTIYNWENGKSRPRQEQFAALASLRGIGKREAARRLEELDKRAA